MNIINLFAIEWSVLTKIALLVLAGIIFVLVVILFVYEVFFRKDFVYKVTYYTTDDPEYAIRTTAPNTSIVTVGKNEDGFVISKIILTKTVKHSDLSDPNVSAKMASYNIKDIVYKSSQAKIVGEYESKESDMKFTSVIVTKKK